LMARLPSRARFEAGPVLARRTDGGSSYRHVAESGRIADGSHAPAGFDSRCGRAIP